MTISVVQTVKSNSATVTIAATGGAGSNALLVTVNSFGTATPSISSVKLGSASLTAAVTKIFTSGGDSAGSWIYYLAGIATGQTTVTITGTGLVLTSGDGGVCVQEVSGLATSSVLDKTNSGGASSASWSSGSSGTLSQASEFVLATVAADSPSSPAGWTNNSDSGGGWITGYQIVSATTALTYSGTATSGDWAAGIATFKGAASNVSVALVPATVTIAAPAPGAAAGPLALARAQVAVAAQPVTPLVHVSVALVPAAVIVAAQPVTLPVYLPAARVTVTAVPPAVSIPRQVALTAAAVTITAYPVTLPPRQLLLSIAAGSCTDDYGNTVQQGMTAYGPDGSYAQVVDGGLNFSAGAQVIAPPDQPGAIAMYSGVASGTDTPGNIAIFSREASGTGMSQLNLTTVDTILCDLDIPSGYPLGGAPPGYSDTYAADQTELINDLIGILQDAGIIRS